MISVIKAHLLPLIMMLGLLSCANVKQIDRGILSRRIMNHISHPEEEVFLQEVQAYREGAIGGSKAVGGGCGCN
ncbi:MAG: DUF4266 domain-containing protein [Bacteriovoracaceae bacterium]|jgi:hypothetical protein|nr:DUF4266 domain-containing protein [Bacteriovoracaceae bacterium]